MQACQPGCPERSPIHQSRGLQVTASFFNTHANTLHRTKLSIVAEENV